MTIVSLGAPDGARGAKENTEFWLALCVTCPQRSLWIQNKSKQNDVHDPSETQFGKQQQQITLTGGLVTLSLAIYLETHDISDKSMDKT